MEILLICMPRYTVPPIRGGSIELLTYELSKQFSRKGHRVTTFSVKDPVLPYYEENEGIRYFRFGALPVLSLPKARLGLGTIRMASYSLSTLLKTIKMHLEVNVIQCFNAWILSSQIVSRVLLQKHVIVSVHWLSKKKHWRLLRLADRVTTPSQYAKRVISAEHGIPEEKIEVIYNGVDTERFSPKIDGDEIRHKYGLRDSPLILFVGRVVPEKGVGTLLKSIPLVAERIPDVKVLIVGPIAPGWLPHERDRYKRHINDLLRKLRCERNVVFTGPVDVINELPKIYAACNVFGCPSIIEEVFPLVGLEAMSTGKPVVATRSGGLPEIVKDHKTGYVVPEGQERELSQALIALLEDEKLQRRMGEAARKRTEALFSWDKIAQKYLELYREVISD